MVFTKFNTSVLLIFSLDEERKGFKIAAHSTPPEWAAAILQLYLAMKILPYKANWQRPAYTLARSYMGILMNTGAGELRWYNKKDVEFLTMHENVRNKKKQFEYFRYCNNLNKIFLISK